MANITTIAEGAPELHKKHDVSCVAFQTLVFSLALTEVALWGLVWRVPVTDERVYHQSPIHFLVGSSQVLLLVVLVAALAVYVLRGARSRPLSVPA